MHPLGGITVIFFDFDGTLTATPGEQAVRAHKRKDLCNRAAMLSTQLWALRQAGATLAIVSKSTETTIRDALGAADLQALWNGPIVGKAVGLNGKVGFIEELVHRGKLQ